MRAFDLLRHFYSHYVHTCMVPGTPEGTSFTEHDHLLHGKRPRRRVSKPILPLRQPRRKLMFNINKILRTRKCRSKSELFLRPEFQDAFLIAAGDILSYTTFELSPIPQFFSLAGENDLAERRACMNVTIQRTELAVVRDTPPPRSHHKKVISRISS